MNKLNLKKDTIVLLIIFIVINAVILILNNAGVGVPQINYTVVLIANLLLFILTFISYMVHVKAVNNNNPHAFVRGVMMMMVVKLFVLGAAVVAYLYVFKETKNIPAILVGLLLYIIYSVIDVRAATKLSKHTKKNG